MTELQESKAISKQDKIAAETQDYLESAIARIQKIKEQWEELLEKRKEKSDQ
ncbi:MAG: hypothetical protein ACRC2T_20060 [Thermoguttaceae bacterium]